MILFLFIFIFMLAIYIKMPIAFWVIFVIGCIWSICEQIQKHIFLMEKEEELEFLEQEEQEILDQIEKHLQDIKREASKDHAEKNE